MEDYTLVLGGAPSLLAAAWRTLTHHRTNYWSVLADVPPLTRTIEQPSPRTAERSIVS